MPRGPMVVPGGGAFSYERGTPVAVFGSHPAGYPSSSELARTSYRRALGPVWDPLGVKFDPLAT